MVSLNFGLRLLLVVNMLCFSNQEEADKESPAMDRCDGVQENLLDRADLERHQDDTGIGSDEIRRETSPVKVIRHEIKEGD